MNVGRLPCLAVAFATLAGCKIESVEDIDIAPETRPAERWFSLWEPAGVVDEEASLVEAELRRQMALLTNAALEGRRPGTEGAALTASHLERAMQEIGLSPAGVGGGWRQPVVVRIRNTDDGSLELPGVNGEGDAEILRHGSGILLQRAAAAGLWTDRRLLVDAGWGISAPKEGHDDYAGLEVKGRVVLIREGLPPDTTFDPEATARHGTLAAKLARAHAAGAEGCLIATGVLQAEAEWAQLVDSHHGPRVAAGDAVDETNRPTPLVGWLSAESEAELRAWLDAVEATDGAEANMGISVTTTERTVVDANVIGRIPGNERPSEVIVVLAHWDAGGTGMPLPEGGGAIDNATGVAALLAMARKSTDWVRRGRRPERSIAFVATASDSLEIAGTQALWTGGPLQRADVVAVIALDALSVRSGGPNLGALGLEASTLGERLRTLRPAIRSVEVREGGGPLTPSHLPALKSGIPALTLTRHDASVEVEDRYDPSGPLDDLREDVSLIFDLAWSYAESSDRPELTPPADALSGAARSQ